MVTVPADPVATGLVASLAKPGGNVTGLSFVGTELAGTSAGRAGTGAAAASANSGAAAAPADAVAHEAGPRVFKRQDGHARELCGRPRLSSRP